MRGDWISAWFPDLKRVESGAARWHLWRAAYAPLLKSPTYYLIAGSTQVGGQIAVVVPMTRLAKRWGIHGPFVESGLPVLVALLACVVIVWLVRRGITQNIRGELVRRGLPTCLACGYDLTGNVTGRCSECGSSIPE